MWPRGFRDCLNWCCERAVVVAFWWMKYLYPEAVEGEGMLASKIVRALEKGRIVRILYEKIHVKRGEKTVETFRHALVDFKEGRIMLGTEEGIKATTWEEIDRPRLLELLIAHIELDEAHPYGQRRTEYINLIRPIVSLGNLYVQLWVAEVKMKKADQPRSAPAS